MYKKGILTLTMCVFLLSACGGEYKGYKDLVKEGLNLDSEIVPQSITMKVKDSKHYYSFDDSFTLSFTESDPVSIIWKDINNTSFDPKKTNKSFEECQDYVFFDLIFNDYSICFNYYDFDPMEEYVVFNHETHRCSRSCRWLYVFDHLCDAGYLEKLKNKNNI